MPKLDGFEVVRALRADPDTQKLLIVMLTDRRGEEDVLDGLDLGVDEYLSKPFSPRELSMRISRILARGGGG
jgi:DNA-binding response OmpR family regulator